MGSESRLSVIFNVKCFEATHIQEFVLLLHVHHCVLFVCFNLFVDTLKNTFESTCYDYFPKLKQNEAEIWKVWVASGIVICVFGDKVKGRSLLVAGSRKIQMKNCITLPTTPQFCQQCPPNEFNGKLNMIQNWTLGARKRLELRVH